MQDDEIRARIRRLIKSEEIPCEDGCDLWAGTGTAKRCAGCGRDIATTEIEFEVQLPQSERNLFFHEPCHRIWIDECRAAGRI